MVDFDPNDPLHKAYRNASARLIHNGVLPAMAPVLAQTIIDTALHDLKPRLETRHLRTALFTSYFDDGSVFKSLCVIDRDERTVVDIQDVGTACDDAVCLNQTVTYLGVEYAVRDDEGGQDRLPLESTDDDDVIEYTVRLDG